MAAVLLDYGLRHGQPDAGTVAWAGLVEEAVDQGSFGACALVGDLDDELRGSRSRPRAISKNSAISRRTPGASAITV